MGRVRSRKPQQRVPAAEKGRGTEDGTWSRSRVQSVLGRPNALGAPITAQGCGTRTRRGTSREGCAKQGGITAHSAVLGRRSGTALIFHMLKFMIEKEINHGKRYVLYHNPHLLPL